jgi:hypothetical protein
MMLFIDLVHMGCIRAGGVSS